MPNIFSENIFWSIGIVFSLFGIIAAHRLFSYRDKRNALTSASFNLISAFAETQAKIKLVPPGNGFAVYNIINQLILEHSVAIKKFEPFVTGDGNKEAYQQAWDDYRTTATQGSPNAQGEAWSLGISVHDLFENKIHDILKFAEL